MPGFKFELSQLVMVPGKNQQGRISGRMEFVNGESAYQIKWLDDDLDVYTEMFKESEVVEAQRSPASEVASLKVTLEADTEQFHKGVREAIGSLRELNEVATPSAVAALRATQRRKRPARNRKSRRKARG